MTTFNTGTQLNSPLYQYTWKSILTLPGTSVSYNFSFGGLRIFRSNSGVGMTDTLPTPNNSQADGEFAPLVNGWFMDIVNTDTVAPLTILLPTGVLINGNTTTGIIITPGQAFSVYSDGVNYFTLQQSATRNFLAYAGTTLANMWTYNGYIINRSNATVAMSDTLPNANTLPIGWNQLVKNTDTAASDTITPITSLINGAATLVIAAGAWAFIYGDGTNYWATT